MDDDQRKRVAPGMNASWTVSDEGRSTYWQLQPQVRIRPAGNVTAQLGAVFERNDDDDQFLSTAGSPTGTRYLFARLEQRTLSLTGRLDYTIRPTLSLQLYAEPFVTAGRYANVRQLATARAEQYADRYQPWSGQAPDADFNVKQLRTNTVLRWEYRPGSTLFVVWSQGRNQNERDPGSFEPRRDYGNLFAARPDNVFLVKGSYWVSF